MNEYYDGTRLLSTKDINNDNPEIFLCVGNRTAGKTTYFERWCINKALQGSPFVALYRNKYEIKNVAHKFFDGIQPLFFNKYSMTDKKVVDGIAELTLINLETEKSEIVGFAVALNAAENVKKYSHIFNDVGRIIFEFRLANNRLFRFETQKLLSIHTSIARGKGKMVRYVPTILISNSVTLLNPYYIELGISNRLRNNTKILKGEGFVLEQTLNEYARKAQKESAFNRAFKNNIYNDYASENVYLNDNMAFIDKEPPERGQYIATLLYKGKMFALYQYSNLGFLYVNRNVDATFSIKYSITTDDFNINYIMLNQNKTFFGTLRKLFHLGCFRFKDLECKQVILDALSF